MTPQEQLLKAIRQHLSKETSLIDELAAVLNISYDASHRRVSSKSKFSIEETVALCHHYGIAMDSIFSNANKVLVEKTREVKSFDDLTNYFTQALLSQQSIHVSNFRRHGLIEKNPSYCGFNQFILK